MKKLFPLICFFSLSSLVLFGQDSYTKTYTTSPVSGEIKSYTISIAEATDYPCDEPYALNTDGEMSPSEIDFVYSTPFDQSFFIQAAETNMVTIELVLHHDFDFIGGGDPPFISNQAEVIWLEAPMDIDLTVTDDGFIGMGTKTYTATFPIEASEPSFYQFSAYSDLLKISFFEYFTSPNNPIVFDVATKVVALGKVLESQADWTTQAPAAVQMILRDPPGDGSYSFMNQSTTNCHGYKVELASINDGTAYATAKIGVSGSAGFLIESSVETYAQIEGGITMGREQVTANEHKVCFTINSEYRTDAGAGDLTGSDADIFIGKSITYAYGIYRNFFMDGCNIDIESNLMLAPINTGNSENSFVYSGYTIKNTIIPDLQAQIDGLTVGSAPWQTAIDQMEMWTQAIDQNEAIRNAAIASQSPINNYLFGSSTSDLSESITTDDTRSMYMNLYVDAYVGAEIGADVGGSGGTLGFKLRTKVSRGSTSTASNSSTNTIGAHFEDNSPGDNFSVDIYKDQVFGTPIYVLDSLGSKTSCPYEGGYQRDQPKLIFNDDSQNMTLSNIPSGTPGTYLLKICNDSNEDRTYYLKGNASTNLSGAVIEGFGNNLFSTNDDGVEFLNVPANDCLDEAAITITQANTTVLDYENIELSLYVLCQPSIAPISSSVFLNAHFEEPTAVGDLKNVTSLEVFPNPNHGQFNIKINGSNEAGLLILTDMTGRKIFEKTIAKGQDLIEINQNNLTQGVCFLSFVTDKYQTIRKIIIE